MDLVLVDFVMVLIVLGLWMLLFLLAVVADGWKWGAKSLLRLPTYTGKLWRERHPTLSSYCSDPGSWGNRYLLFVATMMGLSLSYLFLEECNSRGEDDVRIWISLIFSMFLLVIGFFHTDGLGLVTSFQLGPWRISSKLSSLLHLMGTGAFFIGLPLVNESYAIEELSNDSSDPWAWIQFIWSTFTLLSVVPVIVLHFVLKHSNRNEGWSPTPISDALELQSTTESGESDSDSTDGDSDCVWCCTSCECPDCWRGTFSCVAFTTKVLLVILICMLLPVLLPIFGMKWLVLLVCKHKKKNSTEESGDKERSCCGRWILSRSMRQIVQGTSFTLQAILVASVTLETSIASIRRNKNVDWLG